MTAFESGAKVAADGVLTRPLTTAAKGVGAAASAPVVCMCVSARRAEDSGPRLTRACSLFYKQPTFKHTHTHTQRSGPALPPPGTPGFEGRRPAEDDHGDADNARHSSSKKKDKKKTRRGSRSPSPSRRHHHHRHRDDSDRHRDDHRRDHHRGDRDRDRRRHDSPEPSKGGPSSSTRRRHDSPEPRPARRRHDSPS